MSAEGNQPATIATNVAPTPAPAPASSPSSHSSPHFNSSEFDHWHHRVQASLSGWEQVVDGGENYALYKKKAEGANVYEVRGHIHIDAPPPAVLSSLYDPTIRMSWDKSFESMTKLEVYQSEAHGDDKTKPESSMAGDMLYSVIHTPFPLTTRDSLQHRAVQLHHDGSSFMYLYKSIVSNLHPPVSDRVRSESAGAFHGEVVTATDGSKRTIVRISMQSDPKGSIPTSIINVVAPQLAAKWLQRFKTHCELKHTKPKTNAEAKVTNQATASAGEKHAEPAKKKAWYEF